MLKSVLLTIIYRNAMCYFDRTKGYTLGQNDATVLCRVVRAAAQRVGGACRNSSGSKPIYGMVNRIYVYL